MVLESTFICVDNSEYMRNGDFLPTRLQAQQDAVNLVTQSKLRSNPESNVGLMTLSELSVLVTLTTDTGKILGKLHAVQPKGGIKFIQGLKIAHLALKHRQGKNHKTRIVAFVGSPIEVDEATLVKLAKKLKKEKVNVDVISFGEEQMNAEVLKKFVETVNGKDGTSSHLVTIPPGPHLADALISSPIIQNEDGSGGNVVVSSGGGGGFEFGVDPNEDPELALALRVSMEEQRARQEAENRAQGGTAAPAAGGESGAPATTTGGTASATAGGGEEDPNSEEALLQRALAMSMETGADGAATGGGAAADDDDDADVNLDAMTEEEQIAYAMRMSMGGPEDGASGASGGKKKAEDEMEVDDENDPAFLQSVLENLPGVDPQSDAVKQAMGAISGGQSKKDDNNKDDKKKDESKK